MQTVKYVHWQEGDAWLGYLQDYPDYWTQGETLADLLDHLADLHRDLSGGHVPGARKFGEVARLPTVRIQPNSVSGSSSLPA